MCSIAFAEVVVISPVTRDKRVVEAGPRIVVRLELWDTLSSHGLGCMTVEVYDWCMTGGSGDKTSGQSYEDNGRNDTTEHHRGRDIVNRR